MRTPLNAVLGFAQLLQIDAAEPLGTRQRRHVGLIRESGEHLLAMIGELLDLTRVEAGRLELAMSEFALAPLLRECVDMLQPQADAAGISIVLETADGRCARGRQERRSACAPTARDSSRCWPTCSPTASSTTSAAARSA